MSGLKKPAIGLLLLIFAAVLALNSAFALWRLDSYDKITALVNSQSDMNGAQAEAIQKENDKAEEKTSSFVIWGEKKSVSVANADLGRSAQVSLITACGRTDLIYPNIRSLDRDDLEGCLIDKKTSLSLFGDAGAVGQTVSCGGKDYVVRGMIPDGKNVMVIETVKETDSGLDRVTVLRSEDRTSENIASLLSNQYGISGEVLIYPALTGLSHLLFLLLPLIIGIMLLQQLLRFSRRACEKKQRYIRTGIFAAAVLLFLFLVISQFRIPQEIVPTKWSDFSFWSTLYEKEKNLLLLFLSTAKHSPEMEYMILFLKSMLCSCSALFLLLLGTLCLKGTKLEYIREKIKIK